MTTSPTTDQPELLPCPNPWCASHTDNPARQEAYAPVVKDYTGGYSRVVCAVCPLIGPVGNDGSDAIAAWNTRLTSTTPTLGDMVIVPRDTVAKMARDAAAIARLEGIAADDEAMGAKVGRILDALAGDIAALSATPASPIPISVNGAGEREDGADVLLWANAETCIENAQIAYDDSIEDEDGPIDTVISSGDLGVVIELAKRAIAARNTALSPALDNTGLTANTMHVVDDEPAPRLTPAALLDPLVHDNLARWIVDGWTAGAESWESTDEITQEHAEGAAKAIVAGLTSYADDMAPALDNTAVEGQERAAKAIKSATALAEIVEDVLEWGGAAREHDLQVAYDQLNYDLAAFRTASEGSFA